VCRSQYFALPHQPDETSSLGRAKVRCELRAPRLAFPAGVWLMLEPFEGRHCALLILPPGRDRVTPSGHRFLVARATLR
jgi:hypothetical protein